MENTAKLQAYSKYLSNSTNRQGLFKQEQDTNCIEHWGMSAKWAPNGDVEKKKSTAEEGYHVSLLHFAHSVVCTAKDPHAHSLLKQ